MKDIEDQQKEQEKVEEAEGFCWKLLFFNPPSNVDPVLSKPPPLQPSGLFEILRYIIYPHTH